MDLLTAPIVFEICWPHICPGIVSDMCGASPQFYRPQGVTDDITNVTGAAQNRGDCIEMCLHSERRTQNNYALKESNGRNLLTAIVFFN